MSDISLPYATAAELGTMLRAKGISSVELTTEYLTRLETLGPQIGAVAHVTRDLALAQAKQADEELAAGKSRGPLHGIPYGAKDLLSAAHLPTEWGSPAHQGQVFDYDATVITKLREAGAVLVGKLAMVELAGGGGYSSAAAASTGAGRTPWNREHWAGGSSSGPGAATAAGLVGFAIGSETWGSIVCPSSFCGVSGLRPTFGRVSRYGAMALSWTMDKVGPMARSAEDCGLILEAIAGLDALDPTTSSVSTFKRGRLPTVKGMTLGVVRPDYGKGANVQPETEQAFAAALQTLIKMGITLTEAKMPDMPTGDAAGTIISVEGSAAFETMIRDKDRLAKLADDSQQGGLLAGLVIPGVDYVRSLRLRTLAQQAVGDLFAKFDALVAPGFLQVAPPVDGNMNDYFVGDDKGLSGFGNLTGIPALCVPMGFGPGHLPLGLQLVGAGYTETTLLALGRAYQKATDWHRQQPPAPFGV